MVNYKKSKKFFVDLKRALSNGVITRQQHLTIGGQYKAGKIEAATKGFERLRREGN